MNTREIIDTLVKLVRGDHEPDPATSSATGRWRCGAARSWPWARRRTWRRPNGLSIGWADRKLRRLRTLGDDWDGYGAVAPVGEALARAHEFLVTLETWPRQVPRPDVMASTEGGVLVEWDVDDVEVIIEFPARGCVNVYLKTPRAEAEGPVEDHLDDLSEALSRLVRLT